MTTAISLEDITVHPVVEQQGPFFDVMEFFPTLTQGAARGEPFLAAAHVHRSGDRPARAVRPELCDKDAAPQHPDRFLRRQHKPRPARPFWNMMKQRPFREEPRGGRARGERHRLRHVHASARRPRRLEHAARERALGADLSQGEIRHGRPRARVLDAEGEGGSGECSLDHRFGAADRRGQARARS